MATKYVYSFGPGKAEGSSKLRDLLGGKGCELAEMTNLGIPVPPGFTITTEAWAEYSRAGKQPPPALWNQVLDALARLQDTTALKFGDAKRPLLVSVRSGARVSMPGMMETILNLGLNDETVEGVAASTSNERFAWDCYRRFVMMFSDVVLGVDRREFERHIEKAVRKEERTKLARDLHDAVKQQLFVITTAAGTIDARLDVDRPGTRAALDQLRQAAREAMTEMDAMIEQLQTTPLENTGLVEALKRQCEALEFRTGAKVTLEVGDLPPARDLPPGAQQELFRGAQEALANAARHARATRITVLLGTRRRHFDLAIRDDGAGFDPRQRGTGMGLTNMSARAAALGASFTLKSAPGTGTLVQFSVPLNSRHPLDYGLRAITSAAVLALAVGYLRVRGLSDSPWVLAVSAVAGIAMVRYAAAYVRVIRPTAAAA